MFIFYLLSPPLYLCKCVWPQDMQAIVQFGGGISTDLFPQGVGYLQQLENQVGDLLISAHWLRIIQD